MSLQDRYIEQCQAEEVLVACMNLSYGLPGSRAVAAIASDIGEGKKALAKAITNQGVPTQSDASLATMAGNVAAIVAHLLNTDGFIWSGDQPTTLEDALKRINSIVEATVHGNSGFSTSSLRKITFADATNLSNIGYYSSSAQSSLQEVYAPYSLYFGSRFIYDCTNVRVFDASSLPTMSNIGEGMTSNTNLIDFRVGKNFTGNESLSMWNPTNALLTDSKSCMTEEEIAAHPTWYNRDLLLYNIREHLAAQLPTLTSSTSKNLTFASALKAAILADADTAAAFSSKYWNVI